LGASQIIREVEQHLADIFRELEENAYHNQAKIIEAFKKNKVRDYHFSSSTGYGYGDAGRDLLEKIYAEVFAAEDALVRSQIVSGTHAIAACLFGILQPGDQLISIVGPPYDTLANLIGRSGKTRSSLIEKGIKCSEVQLNRQGEPDFKNIARAVNKNTKMVLIQRSRGYNLRPSLSVKTIASLIKTVKKQSPSTIILVDNCYGEFTETQEPTQFGADIVAGSLIKNPGGGLAPSGGYIIGKKDLVEQVAYHITAPGLGKELGASLINKRYLFQGLFLAPHVVMQALKGAVLCAYVFERYGYEVFPGWKDQRADIVQAIKLNTAEEMLKFCQVVQDNSPVDSDVILEFAGLPGYREPIVMAAGTFVQGSSIELSCDAPLRKPYCVYLQGGLTYEHCRYVLQKLIETFIFQGK